MHTSAALSYSFWYIWIVKLVITTIFFSSNPALGTAFGFGLSLLFLCAAATLALMKPIRSAPIGRYFWLLAFLGWSGLSLLWTSAASTEIAGFYWFAMSIDCLTVWLLVSVGPRGEIINYATRGIIAGGVTLSIIALFFLSAAGDGRIGTSNLHANSIGNYLAVSLIVSAATFLGELGSGAKRESLKLHVFIFFVILAGLIYTLSKTSIIGAAIAILFLFSFTRRIWHIKALLLVGVCAAFWQAFTLIASYLDTYAQETGFDGSMASFTFTGRTILWEATFSLIRESFLLGYGLMSFRDAGPDVFTVRIPHAHNGYFKFYFRMVL